MHTTRPMSRAALAMKSRLASRGIWTIVASFVVWAASAGESPGAVVGTAVGWLLFLSGIAAVGVGLARNRRARRFNHQDSARADRIHAALDSLWRGDRTAAYTAGAAVPTVRASRLVEHERHFDAVTAGHVAGVLQHRLGFLGNTFGTAQFYGQGPQWLAGTTRGQLQGNSQVALRTSTTTRANLMENSLFAVLEICADDGSFDTLRVIGLSQAAIKSWIVDLVHGVADRVGGPATHAGQAVAAWATALAEQYGASDVGYATDQLAAAHTRPGHRPATISVGGIGVAGHAILASTLRIDDRVCHLFPQQLPALLGTTVGDALGLACGDRSSPGEVSTMALLPQAG